MKPGRGRMPAASPPEAAKGKSFGIDHYWQPALRMYITPFMTARMSVRRLPPPRLAGGINGSTYAHSSSVRSLGYLK
jgi:hypothetical protein